MLPLSTFAVVIINYERKCRTFERSWTRQLRDAPETSFPARCRYIAALFVCPIFALLSIFFAIFSFSLFFALFSHDDHSDDDDDIVLLV